MRFESPTLPHPLATLEPWISGRPLHLYYREHHDDLLAAARSASPFGSDDAALIAMSARAAAS